MSESIPEIQDHHNTSEVSLRRRKQVLTPDLAIDCAHVSISGNFLLCILYEN